MEKYGIYVPLSEVGYETVFLYKEEMDEQKVLVTLMKMGMNIS